MVDFSHFWIVNLVAIRATLECGLRVNSALLRMKCELQNVISVSNNKIILC